MPYGDLQKRRDWYHRTKGTPHQRRVRQLARKRRQQRKREWFALYRAGLACEGCGERDPACLQFHHRDRRTKSFCIADAVKGSMTLPRIKKEIAKCRVLCANCHFKSHSRKYSRQFLPRKRPTTFSRQLQDLMNAIAANKTATSLAELVPEEWCEEAQLAASAHR